MTAVCVASYWPLFNSSELRRFDYTSEDPSIPHFTSVFSYDIGSQSMLYNNYDSNGVWLNRWYYNYQPGFGIAEWRDDYPGGKKVVMDAPIGWGNTQQIGSSYVNYPQMVWWKSWPPAFSKGVQTIAFEQMFGSFGISTGTYNNVLQFSYLQAWDDKPATGARYWMAEGVGPIALEWLAQDPKNPLTAPMIVTARMDAVVSSV